MGSRASRWFLRAAAIVPLLAMAAGCGDDSGRSEPSPQAIQTAEAVSRDVRFGGRYSTTPEPDDAGKEQIILDGRVFGDGPTGVILAHMRPSDQTSWFPFATKLAATGDFTVLTFDFRGYGESTGEKQFDRIDTDLEAAFDYARDVLHLEKIFIVGASMGGTAALILGPRVDAAGIVSISSPTQFLPLDADTTVGEITEPKLFITSEDDVPAMRSQERFWELAVPPKEQEVYSGSAHGTDLFATEHAADLETRIIAFLRAN